MEFHEIDDQDDQTVDEAVTSQCETSEVRTSKVEGLDQCISRFELMVYTLAMHLTSREVAARQVVEEVAIDLDNLVMIHAMRRGFSRTEQSLGRPKPIDRKPTLFVFPNLR